jgi:hypothetical protein
MRTDIEEALKGAPHALGIAEAAFLGDSLDWQSALFELAAGRVSPRPFGKLRRRLSDLIAKDPGEIARAHAHAIRQGLYTEIFPRVTEHPGLQFLYVWPVPQFPISHVGAELGLPAGAAGKNYHRPGDGNRNFAAEILFDQGQSKIDPRGDPARGVDISVASKKQAGIDINRGIRAREEP